jgi:hypothetical protein
MGKWLEEAFLQGRIPPRFRLQTHDGSTLHISDCILLYLTWSYNSAGSAHGLLVCSAFSHGLISRVARFLRTIH